MDSLDPLRHFQNGSDSDLIPSQPPSISNQIIEISFPNIQAPIRLAVDASPGCGGIAWPAGEVSTIPLSFDEWFWRS
jgi:hypothetical protein